jgi:hypothetical protein
VRDWRLKLYGIRGPSAPEPVGLDARAEEIAAGCLPSPAVAEGRYGVGFVIIHTAPSFHTILVDWWESVNELRHRVFRAPPGDPDAFVDITASGESVCVWELRVQAFERGCWIEDVLRGPRLPALDAYLDRGLSEDA